MSSTIERVAAEVRPPRKGKLFIVSPTSSSAVISVPPELLESYCSVLATGADAVIVTDSTPTSLAADEGLTASSITALDVDAIKTAIASSASPVVYSGAGLNGAVGAAAFSAGAIVTVTASNHADITGGTIWIEGVQWGSGQTVRVKVTVPNGGNGTFYGTQVFQPEPNGSLRAASPVPHLTAVTRIEIPAQGGTGGQWEIGIHTRTAAAADGALPCPSGVIVSYYFSADAPFMAYASTGTPKLLIARTSP